MKAVLTKHNPLTPRIGVMNTKHDSEAEAKASFHLFKSGWIPCTSYFPQSFQDDAGTIFRAKCDFIHEATGFYAEFKAHKLNGKGNKTAADAASDTINHDYQRGLLSKKDWRYGLLKNAWNHSIQKVAACCKQLPSDKPLVLIYESAQDLNEERRCVRNGVFMLSLDNISGFSMFLRMASIGLAVGFARNGFRYSVVPA